MAKAHHICSIDQLTSCLGLLFLSIDYDFGLASQQSSPKQLSSILYANVVGVGMVRWVSAFVHFSSSSGF
jgi:hypothetical protein